MSIVTSGVFPVYVCLLFVGTSGVFLFVGTSGVFAVFVVFHRHQTRTDKLNIIIDKIHKTKTEHETTNTKLKQQINTKQNENKHDKRFKRETRTTK